MVDLAALDGYLDHFCTAPVSAINAGCTQLRTDSTAVSERENAFLSLMQRDRMAAGIFHGGIAGLADYLVDSTSTVTEYGAKL
jgi:hypothetical protein